MPQALEDLLRRGLAISPQSWNPESLSFSAVISTGADVERRDARGPYVERLDLSAVDPSTLVGIPVLDGHRQGGSEHVVGVVTGVRREGSQLVADMRLTSSPDAAGVATRVAEGVLRGVSIGYGLTDVRETTEAGRRVRTGRPRILEVSLVAIPADPASLIRSQETSPMPEVQTATDVATIENRAAINAQIRSLAETAGLGREFADSQIDAGATVEAARAAAFDAMQARGAAAATVRAHVGVDHTDPAVIIGRQAEALSQRMGGPAASEAARTFVGHSLQDIAREALRRAGQPSHGMSSEEILVRAMHTTSDFPAALDQAGNRTLLNAYQVAQSPILQVTRQRTVPDLRDVTVIKAGEISALQPITEAGEIKSLTMGEAKESYSMVTYGGILPLTRKLLINDQLGVFGDALRKLGMEAAAAEARAVIELLQRNGGFGPTMDDGQPLFDLEAHNNINDASRPYTGGTVNHELVGHARKALRAQKGVDGVEPVAVTPRFLVVGPENETHGEKLLASLAATKVDDVNVFSGRLELLVEPRITGPEWYLFGDPATAPVLERAYLASAQGPQIQAQESWERLGREYRVFMDLGVGAVDWRGAYRNDGIYGE